MWLDSSTSFAFAHYALNDTDFCAFLCVGGFPTSVGRQSSSVGDESTDGESESSSVGDESTGGESESSPVGTQSSDGERESTDEDEKK